MIYCISGLGADYKIFKNLEIPNQQLIHLPWLQPAVREGVEEYALRMSQSINHNEPVIIGVSFGGMIAIEIAKQVPVKKVILISSAKTREELPRWMRVSGKLNLNKVLPVRSNRLTQKLNDIRLGVSNEEEKRMADDYRRNADPLYLEWAVNAVLNWCNQEMPDNIVHIHGNKDKIFPLKNIKADYIIEKGTHMMIYNRASDISKILLKEINS